MTQVAIHSDAGRWAVRAGALRPAYEAVRAMSRKLAAPLSAEDQCVQSMPDASPTKWHLAHTTWFFEAVILAEFQPAHKPIDPRFHYLFNSYYEALGPRHPRPQRGLLTRPSVEEVMAYRRHVDEAMTKLLETPPIDRLPRFVALVELGLNHEQQHQELLLTDIKHALAANPLLPAYVPARNAPTRELPVMTWVDFPGGLVETGHAGDSFAFDNETPRHQALLRPYRLASRPVTNGEYLEFMADGGYERPEFWLSDGWAKVNAEGWRAPLYWAEGDGLWNQFTLAGERPVDPAEPVAHVSLYEAAAFSEWIGARLPTEFEWEAAAAGLPTTGNLLDPARPHPKPAEDRSGLTQMFGDVWEWTRSSYDPYPGFKPMEGAVAEYNGKFMVGQNVLRGGSCVTPFGHIRASYRNFFPAGARWQFSGIRLASDL